MATKKKTDGVLIAAVVIFFALIAVRQGLLSTGIGQTNNPWVYFMVYNQSNPAQLVSGATVLLEGSSGGYCITSHGSSSTFTQGYTESVLNAPTSSGSYPIGNSPSAIAPDTYCYIQTNLTQNKQYSTGFEVQAPGYITSPIYSWTTLYTSSGSSYITLVTVPLLSTHPKVITTSTSTTTVQQQNNCPFNGQMTEPQFVSVSTATLSGTNIYTFHSGCYTQTLTETVPLGNCPACASTASPTVMLPIAQEMAYGEYLIDNGYTPPSISTTVATTQTTTIQPTSTAQSSTSTVMTTTSSTTTIGCQFDCGNQTTTSTSTTTVPPCMGTTCIQQPSIWTQINNFLQGIADSITNFFQSLGL